MMQNREREMNESAFAGLRRDKPAFARFPSSRRCLSPVPGLEAARTRSEIHLKPRPNGGFLTTNADKNQMPGLSYSCPSGSIRGQFFSDLNWRKTAFLQKCGIGPFFNPESLKLLQTKMFRLKTAPNRARNFSN